MDFTREEVAAKRGKRVRVQDDSFSEYGVNKGAEGKVVDARSIEDPGVGPGQVMHSYREFYVVSVRFNGFSGPTVEDIDKECYESSLAEIL